MRTIAKNDRLQFGVLIWSNDLISELIPKQDMSAFLGRILNLVLFSPTRVDSYINSGTVSYGKMGHVWSVSQAVGLRGWSSTLLWRDWAGINERFPMLCGSLSNETSCTTDSTGLWCVSRSESFLNLAGVNQMCTPFGFTMVHLFE